MRRRVAFGDFEHRGRGHRSAPRARLVAARWTAALTVLVCTAAPCSVPRAASGEAGPRGPVGAAVAPSERPAAGRICEAQRAVTRTYCASLGPEAAAREKAAEDAAESAIAVAIDVLPGETDNLVDVAAMEALPVAILSGPAFDPWEVDPTSIRLGGAPVVKQPSGLVAVWEDLNGDGRDDLRVEVEARALSLGEGRTRFTLTGRMRDGGAILGHDTATPLESVLRTARASRPLGRTLLKQAPLRAEIRILESDSNPPREPAERRTLTVAVLGSGPLDVRRIDPLSLTLDGAPVTRGPGGRLASYRDLDGDGREDLVVAIASRLLRPREGLTEATVRALTTEGRLLEGIASLQSGPERLAAAASAESSEAPEGVSFTNAAPIVITDVSPATPYPSAMSVSGLPGVITKMRVSLNGLSHTCLPDVDILLVGPTGQNLLVMSDVGPCGGGGASDVTLTFDDHAALSLTVSSPAPTGYYRPSNDVAFTDVFPAPAPQPSPATRLGAFSGSSPNGTWRLYVVDQALSDTGVIAGGWTLNFILGVQACNPTPVTIPAGAPGTSSGPASSYPSSVLVAGLTNQVVNKVSVTLNRLTHTFPDDLDIELVGPDGDACMVMSDAGGPTPISDLSLTLDRDVAAALPDSDPIPNSSRSWRPADWGGAADAMPAPAPVASTSDLNTFIGDDPNGTWSLFVADDALGDTGALTGGWCLNLTTVPPASGCNAGAVTIPAGAPATTAGPASPYPSTIVVPETGIVMKTTVTLNGTTHSWPDDLDVLLISPQAPQNAMIVSDAGGSADIGGLALTFDDLAGAPPIPDGGPVSSGTYRTADYEAGETLPAPAPAGPYGTTLDNFRGYGAKGTWRLYIADDASGDAGSLAGGWCLNLTLLEPSQRSVCNAAPIAIPSGSPGTTTGPAAPYPSEITVTDGLSPMQKVLVTLWDLNHTFPDDLDVLLVGPQGQTVMLMSDAGGSSDVADLNLQFSAAAFPLPDTDPLMSGVYAPTDYLSGDSLPAPAPAGPYSTNLALFDGADPNGTWSPYVYDDTGGDFGTIGGGWCLELFSHVPIGEASNLRWRPNAGKTIMDWDVAPNAQFYRLYSGEVANLPQLLTGVPNGCIKTETIWQDTGGLLELPLPGRAFWFLVVGANAGGEGPAGFARLPGGPQVRIPNGLLGCP